MEAMFPIAALVCITIISVTAIGSREDSRTANKALDTITNVLKHIIRK